MEKSFFFDAVMTDGTPDRVYSSSDLATEKKQYMGNGVLSKNGLTVMALQGMNVSLGAGGAVIDGYTYVNTANKTIAVPRGTAVGRIDLLVLRLNLNERSITAKLLQGSPSDAPAPPAMSNTSSIKDIAIAELTVNADVTSLSQSNITDRRTFSTFLPTETKLGQMISSALGELDLFNNDEMTKVRGIINGMTIDGDEDRVLFANGEYKKVPRIVREELIRYETAGEYSFSRSDYPSVGGFYDIEMIGAGGAGGSASGYYHRGGGGGAGAYVSLSKIRMPNTLRITVGAGGNSTVAGDGADGGDTVCEGFIAKGGKGGKSDTSGGEGGDSGFAYGRRGYDGTDNVRTSILPNCGRGAETVFGTGAGGTTPEPSAMGKNASSYGSGGSGGGGNPELGTYISGGKGADGVVIIYGYVNKTQGEL